MKEFLAFLLIFILTGFDSSFSGEKDIIKTNANNLPVIFDYSSIRDTLYTFEPYFIEIDLSTQMGYLHSKTDSVKVFEISTGTKKVLDGVETKTGLYAIQNKLPKWYSQQFDSTLMINWMSFNWGIGFHALQGNGYYKYLGKKKSSHGCVRVSREDAKEIYSKVGLGTPVLVHNGNSAITIQFADSSENYKTYSFSELRKILPGRFNLLYNGFYIVEKKEKLLIGFYNLDHPGLPIGDSKKITKRQLVKPLYKFVEAFIPGNKTVMKIKSNKFNDFPAFNISMLTRD